LRELDRALTGCRKQNRLIFVATRRPLIAYLLPFVSSDKTGFAGEWLTGGYVLLIILITAVHAGAFHFNPVMGLFGYHFYAIRNTNGESHLLICKGRPPKADEDVQVVQLAHGIYLGTGDKNAS
jgi:hypothetical protein